MVKALHFYNIHSQSHGRFLHDRTAIVHSEGFFYMILDVADEKAKAKGQRLFNEGRGNVTQSAGPGSGGGAKL